MDTCLLRLSYLLRLRRVLPLLAMTLLLASPAVRASDDDASRAADRDHRHAQSGRVVAYFTQWGIYSDYLVKNVVTSGSAPRLTHVNYAFALVGPNPSLPGSPVTCQSGDSWADQEKTWTAEQSVDGIAVGPEQPLRGNFQQLRQLKLLHPHLKIMISLGGWTWSSHFSDAALSDDSRKTLVKSCVDLYLKGLLPQDPPSAEQGSAAGVFDGIDVDWEYPGVCGNTCGPTVARPEDTRNFTLLMAEFRRQLDALGRQSQRHYELSFAASAAPQTFAKVELDAVGRLVDFIDLMSYDFHGSWESQTNFQSALFPSAADPARAQQLSVDESVRGFIAAGVPAHKIVIGVPAYSRGWQGVPATNNGLYQPGVAPVSWTSNLPFKDVKALFETGRFALFHDRVTAADWLYDPSAQIFWTYDDAQVMKRKAAYAADRRLGGVMMWELSNDTPDGELVKALASPRRARGHADSDAISGDPD